MFACLALAILWAGFFEPAAVSAPLAGPDADGKYTLAAPGIRAQFIPYAASISNVFVRDRNGIERDIVLGYDNASTYPVDPNHPDYCAIPGRYANRIRNGTFTLDGTTYHTPLNDGDDTLHSGPNGWSHRYFDLAAISDDSVSFRLHDPANSTGMPGVVDAAVTYTLLPGPALRTAIRARAPTQRTPLMPTQHTYWNLDGFSSPSTALIWNHTLHLPYSRRLLEPDPNMVPTGGITAIAANSTNDFWSAPHQLGFASGNADFVGNCGTASGCAGYNNLWIVEQPDVGQDAVAVLSSEWSGIRVEYYTNQPGVVVYSCYWMNGAIAIKKTQGEGGVGDGTVQSGSCVALEAQDWVDGINNPQWGREEFQIWGPEDGEYVWETTYKFSTFD